MHMFGPPGKSIRRVSKAFKALYCPAFFLIGVACSGPGVAHELEAQRLEPKLEFFSAHRDANLRPKALDASQLDDVRGRYVPASELELDRSWGVILWDEGRGSHTGSRAGSSHSQSGNNQQRQSMSTTKVR
jgi:hypothetical protein